jgi:hypothetical protein
MGLPLQRKTPPWPCNGAHAPETLLSMAVGAPSLVLVVHDRRVDATAPGRPRRVAIISVSSGEGKVFPAREGFLQGQIFGLWTARAIGDLLSKYRTAVQSKG